MRISPKSIVKRFYVKYFSGFSLEGEEAFFEVYLDKSQYSVAGFSAGAQQAFDYVFNHTERIDTLILFSPAFFQTQNRAFVRTQLRYFRQDREAYILQFMKNVSSPLSSIHLEKYLSVGSYEELEALLVYQWDKEKIESILARGIEIEIYLGSEDAIINYADTVSFFQESGCRLHSLEDRGHLLQFKI